MLWRMVNFYELYRLKIIKKRDKNNQTENHAILDLDEIEQDHHQNKPFRRKSKITKLDHAFKSYVWSYI